eukprot:TRINITY_DN2959_c0_g4_i1.p1 TRINITY_DN2959_c0_g4~~TRINITY_DN2959_c0_g4_i1.p1  ORF type:complete len:395 (-),score=98.65 TRINITY_DN2959_c0_g4_i1:60-1244(-)
MCFVCTRPLRIPSSTISSPSTGKLTHRLCMGGSLLKWLEKNKGSEREAAIVVKQLLAAVVYIHSKSIVHKDLKPENLLFEAVGEKLKIKVIDFGCSQNFESGRKMSLKVGTPLYMAPEVVGGAYTEKCDVWSCGVILHLLLSSAHPFPGRNESDIFQKALHSSLSLSGSRWAKVSKPAKELLRAMLTKDMDKRCTASEALSHKWIQVADESAVEVYQARAQLNELREFNARHKLQQAALTFIVSQLISSKEKEQFEKMFVLLDDNKDGKVSREELMKGHKKIFGTEYQSEEEVQRIIAQIDIDGSGFIDLTEFVIATMNKKNLLSRDRLLAAFDIFDKDRSGVISASEVKEVLEQDAAVPEEAWQRLISEVDQNGDGVVSLEEFIYMMQKLLNK